MNKRRREKRDTSQNNMADYIIIIMQQPVVGNRGGKSGNLMVRWPMLAAIQPASQPTSIVGVTTTSKADNANAAQVFSGYPASTWQEKKNSGKIPLASEYRYEEITMFSCFVCVDSGSRFPYGARQVSSHTKSLHCPQIAMSGWGGLKHVHNRIFRFRYDILP